MGDTSTQIDQHILISSLRVFNRVSLAKLVAPVSVELLALRWVMPIEAKDEYYIDIYVWVMMSSLIFFNDPTIFQSTYNFPACWVGQKAQSWLYLLSSFIS